MGTPPRASPRVGSRSRRPLARGTLALATLALVLACEGPGSSSDASAPPDAVVRDAAAPGIALPRSSALPATEGLRLGPAVDVAARDASGQPSRRELVLVSLPSEAPAP